MYIGAHVSIAGGFDKCLDRIAEMGGNCLMTFASSPRSLQTNPIKDEVIEAYQAKKAKYDLGPHFFHGVYLVNLCTPHPDYLQPSIDSLSFYQRLAGQIGAVGTIFHLGSHQSRGFAAVKNQLISAVNQVLENTPPGVKLIFENAAGQSGAVGENFSELKDLFSQISSPEQVAFCLDTQHSFASGHKLENLLDEFDKEIGLKHLAVIHLNDSLTDFGSHVDRHANLGEGKIGLESLKKFVNDSRLKGTPLILEVPGDKEGPRKIDIDTLKSLII